MLLALGEAASSEVTVMSFTDGSQLLVLCESRAAVSWGECFDYLKEDRCGGEFVDYVAGLEVEGGRIRRPG